MSNDLFTAPRSDPSNHRKWLPSTCPQCQSDAIEIGYLRSGMSVEWYQKGHAPKFLSLGTAGLRLSQTGLGSAAKVHGFRCRDCGLVMLPGPLER